MEVRMRREEWKFLIATVRNIAQSQQRLQIPVEVVVSITSSTSAYGTSRVLNGRDSIGEF